jgi:hypothetical protein
MRYIIVYSLHVIECHLCSRIPGSASPKLLTDAAQILEPFKLVLILGRSVQNVPIKDIFLNMPRHFQKIILVHKEIQTKFTIPLLKIPALKGACLQLLRVQLSKEF